MKNRRLRFTLLLLPAVIMLCNSVWVPGRKAVGKEQPSITRVSVILPHKDDGYWELIEAAIKEANDEIGSGYLDVNTMIPQLNYNIPQMIDLLKQQIAAKVDYIVVQGNEDSGFRSVLLDAWEQGIQIICVDTDISDFPEHLYVGTDNYRAGQMLGEKLIELTGGTVKVSIISGEAQYQNLQQRIEGFRDTIEAYPGIEIEETAYDHFDSLTAVRLYENLSEDADALVCVEGTSGKALGSLFSEHGSEYEYVIGFDAHEGVKANVMDAIIKQDTDRMGHQIVEEILHHIETGAYSSNCIYTDVFWVTPENYDEVAE